MSGFIVTLADYEFSIQQAWKLNPPPIKRLCLQEATSTGFLVLENDVEVEYDPEEFLAKAACLGKGSENFAGQALSHWSASRHALESFKCSPCPSGG